MWRKWSPSRDCKLLVNLTLFFLAFEKSATNAEESVCTIDQDKHPTCPLNPLQEQHLRVIASEVHLEKSKPNTSKICIIHYNPFLQYPGAVMTKRNASGHILEISGICPPILEALSKMIGFTYVNKFESTMKLKKNCLT